MVAHRGMAVVVVGGGLALAWLAVRRLRPRESALTELARNMDTTPLSAEQLEELERQKRERLRNCNTRVVPTQATRFDPDDPAMLAHLDEHGWAVVREAAGKEEAAKGVGLFWEFLEGCSRMRRGDVATYGAFPGNRSNGIIFGNGVGHSEFAWFSRRLRRVHEAFARVWASSELIVSFDGANAFRPWAQDEGWKTKGGWLHVDQGKQFRGRHCVQGLLTFCDADRTTGGLVVVDGSHRHHDALMARSNALGNLVFVKPDDPLVNNVDALLVECKRGDLVLWDSRTIHCNSPALEGDGSVHAADADAALLRVVAYVCMAPRALASEEVLRQRRAAFESGTSTNHMPHQFYGNPQPESEHKAPRRRLCEVDSDMRALVG